MNKHLKNALIAFALTSSIAGAVIPAHADSGVAPGSKPAWLSGADLRQVSVRGSGPEADPYFQHRAAPKQSAAKQWLAGADLRRVTVRGSGPEADPYLQHKPAK